MRSFATWAGRRCNNKAYALVLAILLMAFILMLLLSLSTLALVGMQSADVNASMLRARSAALFGVQVALGEIQKNLGPDARVTASAAILDADNDFEQPHWLGVWADPDRLQELPVDDPNSDPQLLTWLVSGNTDADMGGYGPDTGFGGADPNDFVEIVGEASVSSLNPRDRVSVAKVYFNNNIDAYAYWVSDEGAKANIQSEPTDYAARVLDESPTLSLYPQRSGFHLIDEAWLALGEPQTDRAALYSHESLDIETSSGLSKGFFHDLTANSNSLLVDAMRGGLKIDLERVIEMDATQFNDEFLPLVDDDDRMFPSNLPADLIGPLGTTGPRWDALRIFTQKNRDVIDSVALTPNLESWWQGDFQLGVTPILSSFQVYAYVTLENEGTADEPNYRPRIYYMPAVVMWNPYDVTINAPDCRLTWTFHGNNKNIQFGYRANMGSSSVEGVFPNMLALGAVDQEMNLEIPAHDYEPGRAYIFTPTSHSPYGADDIELSLGWHAGFGAYQDGDTAFTNPAEDDILLEVYRLNQPSNDQTKIVLRSLNPTKVFVNIYRLEFTGFATGGNSLNGTDSASPFYYEVYPPLGDSPVPSAHDMLFGVEISLALPELKIDRYVSDRSKGRLLSGFNIRTREVNRVFALSSFTNGFGMDSENRTYSSIFLPGPPSLGSINEQYTIDAVDDEETLAYTGFSDEISNVDRAIYFYLPRGEHPFRSTGDLRFIDLIDSVDDKSLVQGGLARSHGPSFVVGSSYADTFIQLDSLYETDNQERPYPDYSWLSNYQLWDRFFFSGINADGTLEYPLEYGGYQLYGSEPEDLLDEDLAQMRDFRSAASYLYSKGALNINSTSEEAWFSILASFNDHPTDTLFDGLQENADLSAVLSAPIQAGGAHVSGNNTSASSFHRGYRQLSNDEIRVLAAAIVAEIKKRGPFTSMAQFVNRSIDPRDAVFNEDGSNLPERPTLAELAEDPRMMGTLQAAIDKAGLNDDFYDAWYLSKEDTKMLEPYNQNLPPVVPAAMGAYLAGAPGYLSQGALLARLEPGLTARSDTFKIRAYGESGGAIPGRPVAKAVCEVTVQRIYDYIDDTEDPYVFPPLVVENQDYGRRFVIVDFKWLNEGEI